MIIVAGPPGTLILSQLGRAVSRASRVVREGHSAIYKHLLMNLRINSWSGMAFLGWRIQDLQDHVS